MKTPIDPARQAGPALSLSARDWSSHPAYLYEGYRSTAKRGPRQPLVPLKAALGELRQPVYGHGCVGELDHDLTRNARRNGEPIGERMVLAGQVLDERRRPVRNTLVEIWQANAAGRYVHKADRHDAPLDPNFLGAGRCMTDDQGRYRFLTIKPGAYPWGNHPNAWRPQHIHFSLFGQCFASRLVTQMYFPGDPLLQYDPMYTGTPAAVRGRLVADFSLDLTQEGCALGYRYDIVLRGAGETPFESR
ncbi:protocatechuate 3,4-dioxygenase subunit beta [Achromobacter sp. Marseille-Q0513]|uniref:protocatechuate 3,4-dioxygenase subunit beta n=1 Tax=Achromobacter sp. Marseille-Q0513 TaxID=2829161 RepID=UPI001B988988|nr:protocatechuate 3,4-dioxygenase subunit beta [Achromobacter sp. Marseille-Q0513]MBR8655129.1 protocatechuate 3,4-dioxygenase subunit beta [Achromobacter sp. Marseille-Q0513]